MKCIKYTYYFKRFNALFFRLQSQRLESLNLSRWGAWPEKSGDLIGAVRIGKCRLVWAPSVVKWGF